MLMVMVAIKLSYRAAFCGDSGFAGLQKQLHPEVHSILFRRLHVRQFGKLTIQDVRLHNGCHKPEINMLKSLIHSIEHGDRQNSF